MPLPQKPERRRSRLTVALGVSVAIHLVLLPIIAKDAIFNLPPQQKRTAVSMVTVPRSQVMNAHDGQLRSPTSTPGQSAAQLAPKLPPALPLAEVKPDPASGQVVALGQEEAAPSKPTKYLSEHDTRAEKETRARETSAFFKNALSKVQKEGKDARSKGQAPSASELPGEEGQGGGAELKRTPQAAELPERRRRDSLHIQKDDSGTVENRSASDAMHGGGKRVATADPGNFPRPEAVGPGAPGAAPGRPGTKGPLTLTLNDPTGVLGPVAGGPMPDDLRGVEIGDETLLNSRGFKYAGFLNRVKETVGRVWVGRVTDAQSRRDPSGQTYGYKDRRTVVEYTLDKEGEVREVKVALSSGVQYLDDVAIDAFKLVRRFPNPPPGLVDENGKVTLQLGFVLLAATGGIGLQIGPAYLPGSPAARGF